MPLDIKGYIIAGLVLALAALGLTYFIHTSVLKAEIATKDGEISRLEGKVEKLESSLRVAKDINLKLESSLNTQNEAIKALQDEQVVRERAASEALEKAKVEGLKFQRLYNSALRSPPTHPDDLCLSLDEKLSEYVNGRKGEGHE